MSTLQFWLIIGSLIGLVGCAVAAVLPRVKRILREAGEEAERQQWNEFMDELLDATERQKEKK